MSRAWGQAPGWFAALPREEQIAVIAEHNISNETPAEKARRAAAEREAKRAEFERRLAAFRGA